MQALARFQFSLFILLLLNSGFSNCHPSHAEAAVVFGQNDSAWVSGTAYNHKTQIQAQNDANNKCILRAQNCSVVATFNNQCYALAVQDEGQGYSWKVHPNANQARIEALTSCANMGLDCTIRESFCDSVLEVVKTEICIQPVFREEFKLRQQVAEDPSRAAVVADAINYFRAKYCREIMGKVTADQSTIIGDNCTLKSGLFRGERVYWGECAEYAE